MEVLVHGCTAEWVCSLSGREHSTLESCVRAELLTRQKGERKRWSPTAPPRALHSNLKTAHLAHLLSDLPPPNYAKARAVGGYNRSKLWK